MDDPADKAFGLFECLPPAHCASKDPLPEKYPRPVLIKGGKKEERPKKAA